MCKECGRLLAEHGDAERVPLVQRLRQIEVPGDQGSKEWLDNRLGVLTASEMDGILAGRRASLLRKAGVERFAGNKFTEHGNRYEPVACARYEQTTGHVVAHFGLWIDRDRLDPAAPVGGSPDGVTLCGRLLEIKCPFSRKITGVIPEHYVAQVQLLMHVAQLAECDFVEFRPDTMTPPGEGEVLSIAGVSREAGWWGGARVAAAAAFFADYRALVETPGKVEALRATRAARLAKRRAPPPAGFADDECRFVMHAPDIVARRNRVGGRIKK